MCLHHHKMQLKGAWNWVDLSDFLKKTFSFDQPTTSVRPEMAKMSKIGQIFANLISLPVGEEKEKPIKEAISHSSLLQRWSNFTTKLRNDEKNPAKSISEFWVKPAALKNPARTLTWLRRKRRTSADSGRRLKDVSVLGHHQHRDEVDDGQGQELGLLGFLLSSGKWFKHKDLKIEPSHWASSWLLANLVGFYKTSYFPWVLKMWTCDARLK